MQLPTRPEFSEYEPRLAKWWEENKFFEAKIDPKKKPFTILLPPPNANAPLHAGHVLYVVEDILCRYHRMLGDPTLYLPGTDHAGIETQFVFEKKLSTEDKSRFDFDRHTLYKMIHEFVEENRGLATSQLRRLGFSLDWSREKYTLDPKILETVFNTFRKLHQDGLIYRDERLVNYCTKCGTGFSNLEIDHTEKEDHLYYLNYQTITIATTRPETIFADMAVAVNPNDDRYKNLVGKTAIIPILNKEIPIIADEAVEKDFGTGALKITPGHDQTDFEIGQRHNLERLSVIGRDGKTINVPEPYLGMYPKPARTKVTEDLKSTGLLIKEEPITHSVATCYKCKTVIEPLLVPQWYIKIKPLVDQVLKVLDQKQVHVFPERFEGELRRWLETAPDWNISRQIVWGPQIPAWYDLSENLNIEITFLDKNQNRINGTYGNLKDQYDFATIKNGLQNLIAPTNTKYYLNPKDAPSEKVLQETDTFDTWFSSGQWPLTTLGYPDSDDFKYFYPTTLLDTMWDILPFWVMRMLMLSVYLTEEVPFEWVHLHSRVVDAKGQKMSKSKGNVVNPMILTDKYGADALRFALVFGVAPASDIPLGEEKLVGGRNFVTKLWNIGRFILGQNETFNINKESFSNIENLNRHPIMIEVLDIIQSVNDYLTKFEFSLALDKLYVYIWEILASKHLEEFKNQPNPEVLIVLNQAYTQLLAILHPFMPFITEEIYQHTPTKTTKTLALYPWPHE